MRGMFSRASIGCRRIASAGPVVQLEGHSLHGVRQHILRNSVTSAAFLLHPITTSQRTFHASLRTEDDKDTTAFQQRTSIPTSSWSRPPKLPQDANDDVVPTYYIERKKQRETISERKEEEGGLMAELSAGILSEGVAAQTRTREEKIPVEVKLADGTVAHPSGFEPPTPETDFHPATAKIPQVNDPDALVATAKQLWDERPMPPAPEPVMPKFEYPEVEAALLKSGDHPQVKQFSRDKLSTSPLSDPDRIVPPFYIERKRQRESITDHGGQDGSLMHELNEGLLSDDVAADVVPREEKIPVEVVEEDGTIRHASGFSPPTPETDFHPVASKPSSDTAQKMLWTDLPQRGKRGIHTDTTARG